MPDKRTRAKNDEHRGNKLVKAYDLEHSFQQSVSKPNYNMNACNHHKSNKKF